MKTQIEPRTGQIFLCVKNNKQHSAVKGKHYLYDSGELRTYTSRGVTCLANGDEMLELPGVFERAEGCPFCGNQVYDAAEDKEIQTGDGQEHDGVDCAHQWDAKTKGYCADCNADLESDGSCPKCDVAESANMMINEAVHVMLPTFEKPFPRFFRHVARPTSDAVFIRWNSKRDCCVVTVDGTVRPPACEWNWIDQLVVVDMGHAFEITEQDAAAMLLEVAAGGNPWREP